MGIVFKTSKMTRVSEALLLSSRTLSLTNNFLRVKFHLVLRLSNSSTLSIACTTVLHWAYLSEPLVKESQTSKFDGKPHTACSVQLYTHYRYVLVMERDMEKLHVKKMADL